MVITMKEYLVFDEVIIKGLSLNGVSNNETKYMDWNKVQEIVNENSDSVIYAGLAEDWGYTSGLIYAKGNYYDGYVHGCSFWATPIVNVDGKEIECWTYEETEEESDKPDWWGNGQPLLDECSFKG